MKSNIIWIICKTNHIIIFKFLKNLLVLFLKKQDDDLEEKDAEQITITEFKKRLVKKDFIKNMMILKALRK